VRLHESKLSSNENMIKLADNVGMVKSVVPQYANEVKNRKYFLGAVCPTGFHEGLSKNLPFVSIGSMLTIPDTIIMKKGLVDSTLKDLKSFRGSIGIRKSYSTEFDPAFFFIDRLKEAGLKEGTDYKIVLFPTKEDTYKAVLDGTITATMGYPPDDTEVIKGHSEFGILPVAALNLNMPCCRQVVNRDNLKRDRGKYVRFERAVLRAQRYVIEHPQESIEILSKFLGVPLAEVRAHFQRRGFTLTANPNVRGAVAYSNVIKKRLGPTKVGDVREAVDTSVYEEAIASLVKEDPSSPVYKSMLDTYNKTK
jgi:ABC-type nitrate/sulfonate/bicarbonate transport system substrate-binding protein